MEVIIINAIASKNNQKWLKYFSIFQIYMKGT